MSVSLAHDSCEMQSSRLGASCMVMWTQPQIPIPAHTINLTTPHASLALTSDLTSVDDSAFRNASDSRMTDVYRTPAMFLHKSMDEFYYYVVTKLWLHITAS